MNKFVDNYVLHAQSIQINNAPFKHVSNSVAYEQDVEYMKQSFPSILKRIQTLVEDECDRLEYEGSIMFDEYPDINHVKMIASSIMLQLEDEESKAELASAEANNATLDDMVHMSSLCEDDALCDCEETDVVSAELSGETDVVGDTSSVVEVSAVEDDAVDVEVTAIEEEKMADSESEVMSQNMEEYADTSEETDGVTAQSFNRGPWGPGPWGPPPPGPWGPGPWGQGPWGRGRQCFGPFCPWKNRPCGKGRFCLPFLFADVGKDGTPDYKFLLVENLLTNEMNYRRNRQRSRQL